MFCICKGMGVVEVQMRFLFLRHRAPICCNKAIMAVLLTSVCSVVGNWHMASHLKRPSFICAGQHLFPDGIGTLCSTNTAVRHSGDTTTNFGPGFFANNAICMSLHCRFESKGHWGWTSWTISVFIGFRRKTCSWRFWEVLPWSRAWFFIGFSVIGASTFTAYNGSFLTCS